MCSVTIFLQTLGLENLKLVCKILYQSHAQKENFKKKSNLKRLILGIKTCKNHFVIPNIIMVRNLKRNIEVIIYMQLMTKNSFKNEFWWGEMTVKISKMMFSPKVFAKKN